MQREYELLKVNIKNGEAQEVQIVVETGQERQLLVQLIQTL